MLKQRVITALVLLAILLPALFYPAPQPFVAVVLVLIAAGGWEWGRLNGCSGVASWALGAACLALCSASWALGWLAQPLSVLWAVSGAAWVLGGAWLLRAGVAGWPGIPRPVRLVGGLLALWLAWLAVAQARVVGINFLLSLLLLVWVADIVDMANRDLSDRHLAIGPSHFMKDNLDAVWVEKIWRHAVLPYIEEHFFGEPDRVRDFELARLRARLQLAQ